MHAAEQNRYGLFTCIAMIVGIVIGSGIFFKSDNILVATGGSVFLGVLVFLLGAIGIVFGGLCMSELAARTDTHGGLIGYAEAFAGQRAACSFGWFQVLLYYPTITVVVAWVVGIYTCMLFGWEGTLERQMLIGFGFLLICFVFNVLSAKLGGWFQNATTVIKLLPLAFVAICGLLFGDPAAGFANISAETFRSTGWLAAIGPIAFSYDGWIVSTSISHEVRHAKRNVPLALITAPLFILLVYVLYFVGITGYVGPENVMAMGDAHVEYAATHLLGSIGAKVLLVFVIVSVMGTVNGLVLGSIRLPQSLALRGLIPLSPQLAKENEKLRMPVNSAAFAFALCVFWSVVHYLTTRFQLLPNSDVSEISIAMSYLLYVVLYVQVFRLFRHGEVKGWVRGVLIPVMATVGALLILTGALQNWLFFAYAAFCLAVVAAAVVYYNVHVRKNLKNAQS